MRTELETGVSDDKWIEVTNRRPPVDPEAPGDSVPWTPIDGTEQVILGDLSGLADDAPVEVAPATAATKLASETPAPRSSSGEDATGSGTVQALMGVSDRRVILSAVSDRPAMPPAGVLARCSVSWPPWRRRGATTRPRPTIRASASLRPCG